jgi:hypothetical protein
MFTNVSHFQIIVLDEENVVIDLTAREKRAAKRIKIKEEKNASGCENILGQQSVRYLFQRCCSIMCSIK